MVCGAAHELLDVAHEVYSGFGLLARVLLHHSRGAHQMINATTRWPHVRVWRGAGRHQHSPAPDASWHSHRPEHSPCFLTQAAAGAQRGVATRTCVPTASHGVSVGCGSDVLLTRALCFPLVMPL
jgi:hypothetical protein